MKNDVRVKTNLGFYLDIIEYSSGNVGIQCSDMENTNYSDWLDYMIEFVEMLKEKGYDVDVNYAIGQVIVVKKNLLNTILGFKENFEKNN